MPAPKILIGADPELFVRDLDTGLLVSAHNLLPGTKHEPHPVPKGAIQVDGVAAEFNIDPAGSEMAFGSNISRVLESLRNTLGPRYELVTEPVAVFDKDYFRSLPDSATELGCNPDYNAWTSAVNDPPDPSGDLFGVRTASGHIHIGWTKDQDINDPTHISDCNVVAKELDYRLGLTSMMWDRDNRRRSLYGKAGAVRYKSYGVEYRVMSNKWLSDTTLQSFVFSTAYYAVRHLFEGQEPLETKYGDAVVDTINNNELWWKDKKHPLNALGDYRLLSLPDQKYWIEPKKTPKFKYPKSKTSPYVVDILNVGDGVNPALGEPQWANIDALVNPILGPV